MHKFQRPEPAGLYDPAYEHDNCGVGAVADLSGEPRHQTVIRALDVLDRLEHRGATGPEIDRGDGAGILLQMPHEFLRAVVDFELPEPGRYAAGMLFLPREDDQRAAAEQVVERQIAAFGQTLLGWRDVPVDRSVPGKTAAEVQPIS